VDLDVHLVADVSAHNGDKTCGRDGSGRDHNCFFLNSRCFTYVVFYSF